DKGNYTEAKQPLSKRARALARSLVPIYEQPSGLFAMIDNAGSAIKRAKKRGVKDSEIWAAMRKAHRDAESEITLDYADYEMRGGKVLDWLLSSRNLAALTKSERKRTTSLRNKLLYRRNFVPEPEDE